MTKNLKTKNFNNFLGIIFVKRLEEATSATNKYFGTGEQCAIENKERIEKLQTIDFSYFHGKNNFVADGFQNIFVYQPSFNKLDMNQVNGEYNVSVWKSKRRYTSNLALF